MWGKTFVGWFGYRDGNVCVCRGGKCRLSVKAFVTVSKVVLIINRLVVLDNGLTRFL